MNIIERPISEIGLIAEVSIAFEVHSVIEFSSSENGYIPKEVVTEYPYTKDYDAIPGNHPGEWSKHFDVSKWGLLIAIEGKKKIGSALIAFDTRNVDMLEGRRDLAVLWDIRVSPEYRMQGVGKALFEEAKKWAKLHNCTELKIETQNNNVGAVNFYLKQGAVLRTIISNAYHELPDECMLLFYLTL
ncbi:MAG: GNAT family N-acetyltransferase [Candidatus Cloacimonetes bacterium]|nr:GNAT family N-acetyltransferase [Candidatus Cloacimonadota bacterium]